jgi:hypothetical protein
MSPSGCPSPGPPGVSCPARCRCSAVFGSRWHRAAVAEMHGDQVALGQRFGQQPAAFARRQSGGRCRGSRSGAPYAARRACRAWRSIKAGRHGLVEGGVEHRHRGHLGEEPAGHLDAVQVRGVVQGGERDHVADGPGHRRRRPPSGWKRSPPWTTRWPMAASSERSARTPLRRRSSRLCSRPSASSHLALDLALRLADAGDGSGGQGPPGLRVEELELDGRAT